MNLQEYLDILAEFNRIESLVGQEYQMALSDFKSRIPAEIYESLYNIACPHVGQGKIGKNWYEVH